MAGLPILSFDEAQAVGSKVHDHWVKMNGEAPIPRDNLGWADLVQYVSRIVCERVVEREAAEDEVPW